MLIVPYLTIQDMFLRAHCIVKFVTCVFLITTLFTFYSRWSLSFSKAELPGPDIYLPREVDYKKRTNDILIKQIGYGRPDLAKYIHLDLKGAPPKAEKFYESFFNFLEKLQMGVKGVIIEYEDTLPLQGNLANVSIHK